MKRLRRIIFSAVICTDQSDSQLECDDMRISQLEAPRASGGLNPIRAFLCLLCIGGLDSSQAFGEPPKFEHHIIAASLPLGKNGVGDYGQTAIADLDKDGHPDFVLGRKGPRDVSVLYWFRYVGADKWEQHMAGHETRSDVGLAAIDVDGNGWPDLVTSGAWYKNPGNPREKEFDRYVFDENNTNAHDVLAVDIDGDGKPDIVTLRGPEGAYRAQDGLVWYRIPANPTKAWERGPRRDYAEGRGRHRRQRAHGSGRGGYVV